MYAHIRWPRQNIYPPGCSCQLACHSQFEVDWQIHPSSHFIGFGSRQSQICQFGLGSGLKKNNKKESFHLNRIILCLGILRWGDERPSLAPLTRAVSDKHTWQLRADRTSASDSSQGSYEINNRGRNWITKQKKKREWERKKKSMSLTWPRAWKRWNNCP